MQAREPFIQQTLASLRERAKELDCLYAVDELLGDRDSSTDEIFKRLLEIIPSGWQYPRICRCRIVVDGRTYEAEGLRTSPWRMAASIDVEGARIGEIEVVYAEKRPAADEGPFLKEERRLIGGIAERIGRFLLRRRLGPARGERDKSPAEALGRGGQTWTVLLEFLRGTEQDLLARITRKMVSHLCWNGIAEADELCQEIRRRNLRLIEIAPSEIGSEDAGEGAAGVDLVEKTFDLAAQHLSAEEIVSQVQAWINEEKSTFLIKSLENPGTSLTGVVEAVERYHRAAINESDLSRAVETSLKVALLRRFFTDELAFLRIAKGCVQIGDFYDLVERIVYPANSQGKLGGKGAGLFLCGQALRAAGGGSPTNITIPRTWFLASDGLMAFVHYNKLEEVYNQKYMDIDRVRHDYPSIGQMFQGAKFPPEIVKGLALVLDDLGDGPLAVRSSGLLENRIGCDVRGLYRTVFLANRGSKEERLRALHEAVAEVYSSVFGPDPIAYRAVHGLLDFREEMGVLIQKAVGRGVSEYYFPMLAGRMIGNQDPKGAGDGERAELVMGFGTGLADGGRAVTLSWPSDTERAGGGDGGEERLLWHEVDVMDFRENSLRTVELADLVEDRSQEMVLNGGMGMRFGGIEEEREGGSVEPGAASPGRAGAHLAVDSSLLRQLRELVRMLGERWRMPVEIEFAYDGRELYILQCRPQAAAPRESWA